jgi:THO complex subunit 2
MTSRNILIAPHCNPGEPDCVDVLMTVYNTLLSSTLKTWSPKHTLTGIAFVTFVQSVLEGLPSSSSTSSPSHVAIFGEILVDLIWSVDAELEEIIVEAKVALAACGDQNGMSYGEKVERQKSLFTSLAISVDATRAKQNAETDKATITQLVQKLLVGFESVSSHPTH